MNSIYHSIESSSQMCSRPAAISKRLSYPKIGAAFLPEFCFLVFFLFLVNFWCWCVFCFYFYFGFWAPFVGFFLLLLLILLLLLSYLSSRVLISETSLKGNNFSLDCFNFTALLLNIYVCMYVGIYISFSFRLLFLTVGDFFSLSLRSWNWGNSLSPSTFHLPASTRTLQRRQSGKLPQRAATSTWFWNSNHNR